MKAVKPLLFSLVLIFSYQSTQAQAIYRWADNLWGYGNSNATGPLVVNAKHEVYVTGNIGTTIDFDPGAGVDSVHGTGAYLAKYDSLGQLMWAHNLGAVQILASCKDSLGNYYIAGNSTAATDSLGLGMVPFTLANSGNNDMFIAKYDATDHLVWAVHNGSATCSSQVWGIVADNAGNVYVTGQINGTIDFDPAHPGTVTFVTDVQDGFIAKYSSVNGDFVWAKDIHGFDGDRGTSLCLDPAGEGDLYVTGYTGGLSSATAFGPTNGLYDTLQLDGQYDAFLVKYTPAGAYIWGKAIGSTGNDFGNAVVTDKEGNVYVGGYFEGQMLLNPLLNPMGNDAGFLMKLSSNGTHIWSKMYGQAGGGVAYGYVRALATDDSDRIYASGTFAGSIILNPTAGTIHSEPIQSNWSDAFTVKLDTGGNYKWDIHNYGPGDTYVGHTYIDDSFGVYLSGYIADTTYCNGSNPNGRLDYHAGNPNWTPSSFFAKYEQPGPAHHTQSVGNVAANNTLTVYPNPASDKLIVTTTNAGSNARMQVYDIAGRQYMVPVQMNVGGAVVSTGTLAPGMYLLRYSDDAGMVQWVKFSKL